jgi:hypothetical protein
VCSGRSGGLEYLEHSARILVDQISTILHILGFEGVGSLLRIHWWRAILGGILGTLTFDVVGWLLTGQWWDYPALLADAQGTGLLGGVLHHYLNGVILAINYACLIRSLHGSRWGRVLTYMTIEGIIGAWLIALPLAGFGLADLVEDPLVPLITLVRHWGYGLVLGWIYPFPERSQSPRVGERASPVTDPYDQH